MLITLDLSYLIFNAGFFGLNKMAVFVSYNHNDYAFVDRLAHALTESRHFIWLDKWQLTAGDSIIDKVQSALSKAEAILIVLSQNSIQSNWCKKELNAGLIREIDERKVLLLPLLINDCEIPLFLREKKYADFRGDFNEGLQEVLNALATVMNTEQGRIAKDTGHHSDYGISWGYVNGSMVYEVVIMSASVDLPYSVLTEIRLYPNEYTAKMLTEDLLKTNKMVSDFFVISFLRKTFHTKDDLIIRLTDAFPNKMTLNLRAHNSEIGFHCHITARRLGADAGFDNIINISSTLDDLHAHMSSTNEFLRADEEDLLKVINKVNKNKEE